LAGETGGDEPCPARVLDHREPADDKAADSGLVINARSNSTFRCRQQDTFWQRGKWLVFAGALQSDAGSGDARCSGKGSKKRSTPHREESSVAIGHR